MIAITDKELRPEIETGIGGVEGSEIDLDQTSGGTSTATDRPAIENHSPSGNEVLIMDNDRTTSFFAQPGILAGM